VEPSRPRAFRTPHLVVICVHVARTNTEAADHAGGTRAPAGTPAAPSPVPMPYPTNFLKEEHGQTLNKSHGKALCDHGKGLASHGLGPQSPPKGANASQAGKN
jgi:hypothetical protein